MIKHISIIFRSLTSLKFSNLTRLLGLFCLHPIFLGLSFFATIKTISITKKYFPNDHFGDGVGNAFRHALWCCLIMMYCCKISSPKKSKKWCKKITDLHEELFPNTPLQRKMDLHNNSIGINLFMEMLPYIHRQFFETSFFIEKLMVKVQTAKILTSIQQSTENELVYLKTKITS